MKVNELSSQIIEKHYFDIFEDEEIIYGRVHSVFNDLINVELANKEIIVIASNRISVKPKMIQVNYFSSSFFKVDDKIVFMKNNCFSNNVKIVFNQPEIKNCDIRCIWDVNVISESWIYSFYNSLMTLKSEGLLPIIRMNSTTNNFCNHIMKQLEGLYFNINQGDIDSLSKIINKLIGVGIGLTPSSDDFLVGVLLALYLNCQNRNRNELYEAIAKRIQVICIGKTTKVSEYYIINACRGYFDLDILCIVEDLKKDSWNFDTFMKVKNHGHSSGIDFLVGFYLSLCKINIM
ncbi:DUF2877 domain-containing protein [Anaerorhabdus sp.]|uniref:DUF2877 domain-containing protein n=1 Tax=Anaerorhabdus sp. TaxID=1872524 RepID=UPI002FC98D04